MNGSLACGKRGLSQVDVKRSVQSGASGRTMSRLARLFVLFVLLTGLGTWGGNAYALTFTSNWTRGGTWSTGATWLADCGAAVPVGFTTNIEGDGK